MWHYQDISREEFERVKDRIDEVCFEKAPCIVPTVGTYEELMNNIMDDMDTIPYNLTEEELEDEVSFFLGEKPYPRR